MNKRRFSQCGAAVVVVIAALAVVGLFSMESAIAVAERVTRLGRPQPAVSSAPVAKSAASTESVTLGAPIQLIKRRRRSAHRFAF